MTVNDLLTQLAYDLNKTAPSSMDVTTRARLLGFMNQRQRKLLSIPGIQHLRDDTITFASVADQPDYVIPNIAKINWMRETDDDRTLYEMSLGDYRLVQPDTTITGTPEAFIWRSRMQVAKQPSDASSVFAKSTNAADTTQTVYVEGAITGGYPATGSATLTGTTAVNLSSTFSTWIRVDKFYLSAACAGTVTLLEDSGSGTELGRITIGKTSTDYTGLSLYPTPSGVITYYVDIQRAIVNLSNDTDVPMLPEDFHDLILLGAEADEYRHLKDERYALAEQEYGGRNGREGRVGQLIYWLAETATGRPRSLVREWQRPSQLGPWYPAGS